MEEVRKTFVEERPLILNHVTALHRKRCTNQHAQSFFHRTQSNVVIRTAVIGPMNKCG